MLVNGAPVSTQPKRLMVQPLVTTRRAKGQSSRLSEWLDVIILPGLVQCEDVYVYTASQDIRDSPALFSICFIRSIIYHCIGYIHYNIWRFATGVIQYSSDTMVTIKDYFKYAPTGLVKKDFNLNVISNHICTSNIDNRSSGMIRRYILTVT